MMQIKPNSLRKIVLKMVFEKQSGHIGGCFSIAELIAYLFNEYNPLCEDKIILSKGHGSMTDLFIENSASSASQPV